MRLVLFFLLLMPCLLKGQMDTLKHIHKPIIRIVLTPPPFELNMLAISVEYQFKIPISIYAKAGPTASYNPFDGEGLSRLRVSYNFLVAAEGRYYFLHHKLMSKYKNQIYYYGPYMGLEQRLLSNAWARSRLQPESSTKQGQVSTLLNVGWQKQFAWFYLHATIGKTIFATWLNSSDNSKPNVWAANFGLGVRL